MRYLTVDEVIALHERVISQSGGSLGLRDRGALESAVAQPVMSFGGDDLYQSISEKAANLWAIKVRLGQRLHEQAAPKSGK